LEASKDMSPCTLPTRDEAVRKAIGTYRSYLFQISIRSPLLHWLASRQIKSSRVYASRVYVICVIFFEFFGVYTYGKRKLDL